MGNWGLASSPALTNSAFGICEIAAHSYGRLLFVFAFTQLRQLRDNSPRSLPLGCLRCSVRAPLLFAAANYRCVVISAPKLACERRVPLRNKQPTGKQADELPG